MLRINKSYTSCLLFHWDMITYLDYDIVRCTLGTSPFPVGTLLGTSICRCYAQYHVGTFICWCCAQCRVGTSLWWCCARCHVGTSQCRCWAQCHVGTSLCRCCVQCLLGISHCRCYAHSCLCCRWRAPGRRLPVQLTAPAALTSDTSQHLPSYKLPSHHIVSQDLPSHQLPSHLGPLIYSHTTSLSSADI